MSETRILEINSGGIFRDILSSSMYESKSMSGYFLMGVLTGLSIDNVLFSHVVTKTVHYKQYRNKQKRLCHTPWTVTYMQLNLQI